MTEIKVNLPLSWHWEYPGQLEAYATHGLYVVSTGTDPVVAHYWPRKAHGDGEQPTWTVDDCSLSEALGLCGRHHNGVVGPPRRRAPDTETELVHCPDCGTQFEAQFDPKDPDPLFVCVRFLIHCWKGIVAAHTENNDDSSFYGSEADTIVTAAIAEASEKMLGYDKERSEALTNEFVTGKYDSVDIAQWFIGRLEQLAGG